MFCLICAICRGGFRRQSGLTLLTIESWTLGLVGSNHLGRPGDDKKSELKKYDTIEKTFSTEFFGSTTRRGPKN